MDDLIRRQAAIDALGEEPEVWLDTDVEIAQRAQWRADRAAIEAVPTAEKKGNWLGIDDEPCEVWECDKCGHIVECDGALALPNYCENCGAKMTEESE